MDSNRKTARILEDVKVNVKIKLSALWVAVMFLYVYGDLLAFMKPGHIEELMAGKSLLGETTQGMLLGIAILMAIPSVMVFLSLTLKPKANRWANIILGVLYTVVMLFTMLMPTFLPNAAVNAFYIFLGIVEVVFTVLIVWHALKWPKQEA